MTVSTISTGLVITASDVLILGKSKIITSTRTFATGSGDVAYTGVGFQPRTIIAFTDQPSWGFADQGLAEQDAFIRPTTENLGPNNEAYLITLYSGSTTNYFQKATLKTLDTDGFTLNWEVATVVGASQDLLFLCLG